MVEIGLRPHLRGPQQQFLLKRTILAPEALEEESPEPDVSPAPVSPTPTVETTP